MDSPPESAEHIEATLTEWLRANWPSIAAVWHRRNLEFGPGVLVAESQDLAAYLTRGAKVWTGYMLAEEVRRHSAHRPWDEGCTCGPILQALERNNPRTTVHLLVWVSIGGGLKARAQVTAAFEPPPAEAYRRQMN